MSGQKSKEDVIRAAGRLFAERGFHGTSMRDLGGEVGLLGSSLYSHVAGKNELLIEVIETGARLFQGLADSVVGLELSAADRLRLMIEGHIRIVTEHIDEATTFLNEARFLPDDERSVVLSMRDEYESAFRSLLEEGVATGEFRSDVDPGLATIFVLSMVNALDRWYRPSGANSPEEIAASVHAFTMKGIT